MSKTVKGILFKGDKSIIKKKQKKLFCSLIKQTFSLEIWTKTDV